MGVTLGGFEDSGAWGAGKSNSMSGAWGMSSGQVAMVVPLSPWFFFPAVVKCTVVVSLVFILVLVILKIPL